MFSFALFIAFWINFLGLISFYPANLWPGPGFTLLDYVRPYSGSRLALLEVHNTSRPGVLTTFPDDTALTVDPPNSLTLPGPLTTFPEDTALAVDPPNSLTLPYSFEDDNSSALGLLALLSVPVLLLLYKIYNLLPAEDSPEDKHDDVADEDFAKPGMKPGMEFNSIPDNQTPENKTDAVVDSTDDDLPPANHPPNEEGAGHEDYGSKTLLYGSDDDDLPPGNHPPNDEGAGHEDNGSKTSLYGSDDDDLPPANHLPYEECAGHEDYGSKTSLYDADAVVCWADFEDENWVEDGETQEKEARASPEEDEEKKNDEEEHEDHKQEGISSNTDCSSSKASLQQADNATSNNDSQIHGNNYDDDNVGKINDENEFSPSLIKLEENVYKVPMDEKDMLPLMGQHEGLMNSLEGKASVEVLPPEKGDRFLFLSGEEEEVKAAVTAIIDFSQQLKKKQQPVSTSDPSGSGYGPLESVRKRKYQCKVDSKYAGLIVGKGGSLAGKYSEEFNVNVKLIRNRSTNSTFATFRGYPEDVQKVYQDITAKIDKAKAYNTRKELKKPLEQPEEVAGGLVQVKGDTYVFLIPSHKRQFLVGPAGAIVRELEDKFGVVIHSRPMEGHAQNIECEILGMRDDVLDAFNEIRSLLRNQIL